MQPEARNKTQGRRHQPIPLSRWIRGRVRIHFRDGHVADLEMTLEGAHSVQLQADDARGGDRIDGLESHNGWIAARSDEIVLTEWTPAPDYGWRDISPDDRDQLRKLGMPHGVLSALADLWAEQGGTPSYSIAAISALYGMAVRDDVTRDEWDQLAEASEGEQGASLVASIWADIFEQNAPSMRVDDAAEPAPTSEEVQPGADTDQMSDAGEPIGEPGRPPQTASDT